MHGKECAPFYVLDGPAANTAWGKEMKKNLMALAMAVVGMLVAWAETPTVTDVTAKQRYPWNGLVDISCNVSGVDSAGDRYQFVVVAVDKDSGKEYTASHFSVVQDGENDSDYIVFEDGTYKLLWDARTDLGQVVCDRMAMRVTLEAIALSSGKVQLWEGGPYWADRNIGASAPEDNGLYFWWGDTKGHRPSGTAFSFNFGSDNSAIYTYGKSVSELQSAGWVTSDGVLAPRRDAAHVKWGGGWRMPTDQELSDLCYNKCDWTFTTLNGVKGHVVRGRGSYASNSIFLPWAGGGDRTSFYAFGESGQYLSSVPNSNNSGVYALLCTGGFIYTSYWKRYYGQSIRPVQGVAK